MDTLLSPAETNALQNFLSSIDYHQDMSASEWAMYAQKIGNLPADELLPPTQGSEALTKATKDLMALDASSWNAHSQQTYNDHQEQHSYSQSYQHRRQSSYTRHETFPFLTSKIQTQQPALSLLPPNDIPIHSTSPLSTSTSTSNTPATPHTPFAFGNLQLNPSFLPNPESKSVLPPPGQQLSSALTKRSSSSAPVSNGSTKRIKSSPTASTPSTNGASKQTLLSASQKKANHIQSEQKRRANIRRGYEALCETVPALREAIREEEEAEARVSMGLVHLSKNPRAKRKKRDSTENTEKERDKIDGRAGPRSENVVLSKTIEYINQLLSERSVLLSRLHRARSCLPLGHPALIPTCSGEPLWERKWKGGEGKPDGEGNDEDDENEMDEGEST